MPARKAFRASLLTLSASVQTRAGVVEFMPYSFSLVNKASARFLTTERRYNYTTPKTFLELIKLYTNVLTKKREQTNTNIDRLETGLTKLHKTQKDVDVLVEAAQRMAIQVRCSSGCSFFWIAAHTAEAARAQILAPSCQKGSKHTSVLPGIHSLLQCHASNDSIGCSSEYASVSVSRPMHVHHAMLPHQGSDTCNADAEVDSRCRCKRRWWEPTPLPRRWAKRRSR